MNENAMNTTANTTANNTTELVVILDRSGSMHGLEKDTIGGFNALIDKQKKEEGRALVTTVLFDTRMDRLHDRVSLDQIKPLTEADYVTGGCTALLDAVGLTIQHIAKIHRYARPEDVPAKTIFVITTDGMENASCQFNLQQVRQMIEHEKEKYGWEFLFLGANIDAIKTADTLGIDADCSSNFVPDSDGIELGFGSISCAVSMSRSNAPFSASWKADVEADYERRSKG